MHLLCLYLLQLQKGGELHYKLIVARTSRDDECGKQ